MNQWNLEHFGLTSVEITEIEELKEAVKAFRGKNKMWFKKVMLILGTPKLIPEKPDFFYDVSGTTC